MKREHRWEIVKMSDQRSVKRCARCLYAYEYGYDLPCPAFCVYCDKPIERDDLVRDVVRPVSHPMHRNCAMRAASSLRSSPFFSNDH